MNVPTIVAAIVAVLSVIGNAIQWLITRRDRIADKQLDVSAADATGRHDVRKAELQVVPSLLSRIESLEAREAARSAELMAAREALAHATEALDQERETCMKDRDQCRAQLEELHVQLTGTYTMLEEQRRQMIALSAYNEQVLDLIEQERAGEKRVQLKRPTPPEFPAILPRRSSDPPKGSES